MNQIVTANAPLKIAEPLVFHEEELTESTLPGKFVTVLSVVDIVLIFLIILTLALIKDRKINQEVSLFLFNAINLNIQMVTSRQIAITGGSQPFSVCGPSLETLPHP